MDYREVIRQTHEIDAFTVRTVGDYRLVEQAVTKDYVMIFRANHGDKTSEASLKGCLKERLGHLEKATKEFGLSLESPRLR